MAIRLDRQAQLILLGPRVGQEYGAPTRTGVWCRLLEFNVDQDASVAGVRPAGFGKIAIRWRQDFSTRTSFPGTWTPDTRDEHFEWDAWVDGAGDIRDSFAVDGTVFAITEAEQIIEREARRRYVRLIGLSVGVVDD